VFVLGHFISDRMLWCDVTGRKNTPADTLLVITFNCRPTLHRSILINRYKSILPVVQDFSSSVELDYRWFSVHYPHKCFGIEET